MPAQEARESGPLFVWLNVIPGRIADATPQSRDSGFDASRRPGMMVDRRKYGIPTRVVP
jgi:hypothetical protein